MQIKGVTANKGRVCGVVRIIKSHKDFKKFKRGDVLVADITDPSYSVIIINASAIITNKGGITSHPAIIAREMNIPCIVGTRNATKMLRDGDVVEVNASEGIVNKEA